MEKVQIEDYECRNEQFILTGFPKGSRTQNQMSTSRNWRGWEWGRHGISTRKEEKQKGSSSLVCSENQGSSVERTGQARESTVQVRRWRGPGYDGPWMWHWGAQIPLSKQAAWEAFWARAWQDLISISERGLWQRGSTDRKGWGGAQRQRFKPRKESEALTHVLIACLKRGWMQLELFHISPHLILPTVRRQVSSFFPFYRREKNGSEVKLLQEKGCWNGDKTQAWYFSTRGKMFFLNPITLKSATIKAEWSIISLQKC